MYKKVLLGGLCVAMLGCAGPSPKDHDEAIFWDCNRQGPMGLGRICTSAEQIDKARQGRATSMAEDELVAPELLEAPAPEPTPMAEPVAEDEPVAPDLFGAPESVPSMTVEQRILDTPPQWYAVQLIALSKPESMLAFVEKYDFQDRLQVKTSNGREWYLLLLGLYPTLQEALRAVNEIPAGINVDPWIRPVGNLQDAVRASR